MFARVAVPVSFVLSLLSSPTAQARGPSEGYHPWAKEHVGPLRLDAAELVAHPERYRDGPVEPPDFDALDAIMDASPPEPEPTSAPAGRLPEGWVRRANLVVPEAVARGDLAVDPGVAHEAAVVPGSEYPRKHTLFINFNGGMMFTGTDNSAENRSSLARQQVYPAYTGGAQRGMAIVQAVQEDVAPYGIVVLHRERPPKVVPYTMAMIGGSAAEDTNVVLMHNEVLAGLAPGSDCGALGQRHVVYTFAQGAQSATRAANTTSQEAGHAWGLDHTTNCDSVMSYCGTANGVFSDTCDPFCDLQCQGAGTIGCRLTHEEFCGVDSGRQNEAAELSFLFGTNEPDVEPPTVEILEPEDAVELEVGADLDIRSLVTDNFGGYSWSYAISRNGEEVANFVDYDRMVDLDYRPALNLTGLTEGVWVITVSTEDHYGNTAEDTVAVFVGVPNDTPIPVGDTGDTESGTMDAGAVDDDDAGGGGDGCGCRSTRATSGAESWFGLALLGAWRRQRRRRS